MATVLERGEAWVDRREFPYEPRYLDVDGGRMHYVDSGEGSPVLFVHGYPTWCYLFRGPVRSLKTTHRCIVPDHIGFGMSSKPESWSYSVRSQAANLAQLADRLDLNDITLVLHELGGPIGLTFAFENMKRVGRVVLSNTWFWDTSNESVISQPSQVAHGPLGKMAFQNMNSAPKRIRTLFSDRRKYTEAVHKAYFGPFQASHDRHGAYATAKQFKASAGWFGELWAERKRLLERPLMLLWGMKDPIFDEKALNRIWHEFPLAEVHRYEQAGHYLAEEHPTAMAEAIRAFTSVTADRAYTA